MTADPLVEWLRARILALPGVTEAKSRFGPHHGFHVGGREFAHFHPGRQLDIRLPKPAQRVLADDARAHLGSPLRDWVEFDFADQADAEAALRLVEAAHRAATTPRPPRRA